MSIKQYLDKSGNEVFKVSISLRSQKKQSVRVQRAKFAIETRTEAVKVEQAMLRECIAELQTRENEGESWGELIYEWESFLKMNQSHKINELTRNDYVAELKKHTAMWLMREAKSITRLDVRGVFNTLNENGIRPTHQVRIKNQIHRVFLFGIENGNITGLHQPPTYGLKIDTKSEKKPEILTLVEIKKLLQSAKSLSSPWYAHWAMALFTGMRSGELYALTWEDVDFDSKSLSVTKSYNCRMRAIKSTKAGYWRTVPICSELMTLLKELKLQTGNQSHVLPRMKLWTKGLQAKELRSFCVGIGLPSIKFHTLRACFATQLIRSGVPPIQIQKICGWRDLETMQRYIRLAGIEVEGATEGLKLLPEDAVMGRVVELFTAQ